jgi:methylmalonyl-CoA mutase N-terminal domain/subunit
VFTCAYDEAFQIPTEFSAEIALRTQQIVAYESGVSKTVDPLGGGYYVEWLTDRMEDEASKIIREIDDYGGVETAIEDGYLQRRIGERAFDRKRKKDTGETVVVGENYFGKVGGADMEYGEVFSSDPKAAGLIIERLQRLRASRDQDAVSKTLGALQAAAARDDQNIMPCLVDCCHAYATVGEMVARLKAVWGEFIEPIAF